jgi:hypothetical protein
MANTGQERDKKPLDKRALAFVAAFRRYRDIYRAAERAHVPKSQAVRIFNSPAFQDELDRQDEAVREERARQEVKAEALTNEFLDQRLISVINLEEKTHGDLVLDALRLGNVITGRIQAGNTRSLGAGLDADTPAQGGAITVFHAQVTMEQGRQAAAPILGEQGGEQGEGIRDKGAGNGALGLAPMSSVPSSGAPTSAPKRSRLGPARIG